MKCLSVSIDDVQVKYDKSEYCTRWNDCSIEIVKYQHQYVRV